MSIKVENLTKLFGNQKALDNVSFEIDKGEIVAFLGPNGAGKSTLMKILTGFVAPSDGSVYVDGINVTQNILTTQSRIGYLPEHNPLYLDMYVREYLSFVADVYKLKNKKERVEYIIAKTGLSLEANKKIGSLSKGYRQRVGIAQAIIHDPKVLILDEPTTGLDPNQIIEIRELIKEIGKEKTVLLSTHLMQEVEAICSRVLIIKRGNLLANDTEQHIRTAASKSVFVEFNNLVEIGMLKRSIPSISKIDKKEGGGLEISTSDNNDIRDNLFDFAVSNNLKIRTMLIENQTIEKTFIDLTN